MPQHSRLNPNILLTETCNLACPFCFARQTMAKTGKREMGIGDFQRLLDFLKKNGQTEVRLMGGEPTLHSRFRDIVDCALSRGFVIRLFTNASFPENLAQWMADKKQSITYSVNLTAIAFAPEDKKAFAEKNLKILGEASKVYGSITVDRADFERYVPMVALVETHKFEYVRIAIANNMVANSSNGSVADDYKSIIAVVVKLADKLKKKGVPRLSFNCGFTPCMFAGGEIKRLLEEGIKLRGWGCRGKAGPFDVSADLCTFPCYLTNDLKAARIFDFKNIELAKAHNDDLYAYKLRGSSLFPTDKCKKCIFFKKKECDGPCLGYIYNNNEEKKRMDDFKGSFRHKVAEKIFHIFRNW